MAKQPQVGKTKTRLCPPLSFAQAASLYQALMRDMIELAHRIPGCVLGVAITPPGSKPFFENIVPAGTLLLPVEADDIGGCLNLTTTSLLEQGFRKVVALNADGPSLSPELIRLALLELDRQDVVLGPSRDGGYYLIGIKEAHPELFQDIPWSTSHVTARTLERGREHGLEILLLPEWYDVDTPGDLKFLLGEMENNPGLNLVHTRQFADESNLKEIL
jgi:rSAM/selenodomain-associated transferase 1